MINLNSFINKLNSLKNKDIGTLKHDILNSFLNRNYDFLNNKIKVLKRYEDLGHRFLKLYGNRDVGIIRAPGRVNLIGEHTDYNGCPVLPVAINRDFIAMFSPRHDSKIVLNNVNSSFPERTFGLNTILTPYKNGDWGNYCKAAVWGLLKYYKKKNIHFNGVNILISGTIPPAAGLSSSSALVVICALILLNVNNLQISKMKLAGLLAEAEQFTGTQGGGMDQAASLLSKSGHALKIDFNPFAVMHSAIPPGYSIVIANSMVKASKTKEVMDKYNRRAFECRLCVSIIDKKIKDEYEYSPEIKLLGDLSQKYLGIPEKEIHEYIRTFLHKEPYSLREISELLLLSENDVLKRYCSRRDGTIFHEPKDGFFLRKRYEHIISEWSRVEESVRYFSKGLMSEFGKLMDLSHLSCKNNYEISCKELDILVNIAKLNGALGSRLTGAGFGGSTVSIIKEEDSSRFINNLIRDYYINYLKLDKDDYSDDIFVCKATEGAGNIL